MSDDEQDVNDAPASETAPSDQGTSSEPTTGDAPAAEESKTE